MRSDETVTACRCRVERPIVDTCGGRNDTFVIRRDTVKRLAPRQALVTADIGDRRIHKIEIICGAPTEKLGGR